MNATLISFLLGWSLTRVACVIMIAHAYWMDPYPACENQCDYLEVVWGGSECLCGMAIPIQYLIPRLYGCTFNMCVFVIPLSNVRIPLSKSHLDWIDI